MNCWTCSSKDTGFRCPDCNQSFCGRHWVEHLDAGCAFKGRCHFRRSLGKSSARCISNHIPDSRYCSLHGTIKKRDGTRVPRA